MSALSLRWYARRLRQMSAREMGWRAGDLVRQRSWARERVPSMHALDGQPGPRGMLPSRTFTGGLPGGTRALVDDAAAAAVVAAADRLLSGDWSVLGHQRRDITDPDWFLDEVTGLRAPDRRLAFLINHRDEQSVGNIKSLWEVSRHHHLTLLATAWWLTSDERYASAVDGQLRSWWQENPFLTGVHWTSGIEIGIRLISWTWIRRLLHDWSRVSALFEQNPAACWQLWWHQRFLAGFPSRGSSANNHVVAEAAGLLVASAAFPWFQESEQWRLQSQTLLDTELLANTFPSGVNRELASDYHRFVTELGLIATVEAAAAGLSVEPAVWSLLGRSLDAAAALVDATGRPPRQGDGDDGVALLLDASERETWLDLLALGEAIMGRASWWPEHPPSVAAVVLGALNGEVDPIDHPSTRPDDFVDAGITILRTGSGHAGGTPEIWCRCDGGPHGFLAIAAHAHADALAIELRHDGVDILADPGTYCYHGQPAWRTYFRSTIGHNTLQIAGADQSVPGGPFLWTRHARTVRRSADEANPSIQTWCAEHDGYARLTTPVTHRRTVQLDGRSRSLTVTDEVLPARSSRSPVSPDAEVDVRLAWHLGPDVEALLDGSSCRLRWKDARGARCAHVTLPGRLGWSAFVGREEPILGWYSPSFGVKVPTTVLVGEGRVPVSGQPLLTRVTFSDGTIYPSLSDDRGEPPAQA